MAASPQPPQDDRETDPLVLAKLDRWQDWKFGLMMHWGTYSQWGVVESWTLCSEDEPWCRRSMDDYCAYKKAYEALPRTFNPVKFDPRLGGRRQGRRHALRRLHDQAPRRLLHVRHEADGLPHHRARLSRSTPIRRADVVKAVFDAFRAQGFGIGAYFSKSDWHHPDYWAPDWAHPDRNVNYSIEQVPGELAALPRFHATGRSRS